MGAVLVERTAGATCQDELLAIIKHEVEEVTLERVNACKEGEQDKIADRETK